MKLLLTISLCALCITGCMTQPTEISAAVPVPQERIWPPAKTASTTPAQVVFLRDSGGFNDKMNILVNIDGKRVASIGVGEMVSFNVDPGDRQVSAARDTPFSMAQPIFLDSRLDPGQKVVYRIGFDMESGRERLVMYRDPTAIR